MSLRMFREHGHGGLRPAAEQDPSQAALGRHAARVRRLRVNVIAWSVGSALLTAWWITVEWRGGGAFERFGHDGAPGTWNPTLWAVGVGLWTAIVGMMALQVRYERPPTGREVEREAERGGLHDGSGASAPTAVALRRSRLRLERIGRLRFHIAAWVLAMVLLTPLWALIEWQDNGDFERWSSDSQPGSWDPWILTVGGIWAAAIALLALWMRFGRPR
jgi:hypothetical protein